MSLKPVFYPLALAFAGLGLSSATLAGPVYTGLEGEIAVSGYDPLSYFQGDGVPVPGLSVHQVTHNGAVYHFATAANAEAFRADPDLYAPQYGGHCAWGQAVPQL
jgi:YHS domain-containing protein